jgi:hypothetical protein
MHAGTDIDRLNTSFAGRYRLEREIGAGGMATVYLATDVKHDRQVALKVLRAELAQALGHERFLREIKMFDPDGNALLFPIDGTQDRPETAITTLAADERRGGSGCGSTRSRSTR